MLCRGECGGPGAARRRAVLAGPFHGSRQRATRMRRDFGGDLSQIHMNRIQDPARVPILELVHFLEIDD